MSIFRLIRQRATGPFWYGKWSRNGQPVIRALGRAWVEPDGNGSWHRRRGRAPEGVLTEAQAYERMLGLVRERDAEQMLLEHDAEERRRRGVTFRELASEYLRWLEDVKDAKPSTLRDHRFLLAEPGQTYRRGRGTSRGLIMGALGDRPAREVTTREVEDLLRSVSSTGVGPRTVNKVRPLVCAIINYGMRPSTYALPANPAEHADRRRGPDPSTLAFYSMEQVEALARALAVGRHRDLSRPNVSKREIVVRACEEPRTRRSFGLPPMLVSAAASSSRSAGATSTSPVGRLPSGGRSRATPSCAQRRVDEHARCRCRIERGPGDNQVHSADVRTRHVTCKTARRVIIRCARFSYGNSGYRYAVYRRWYCTSRALGGLESSERCTSSGDRMVRWIWLD